MLNVDCTNVCDGLKHTFCVTPPLRRPRYMQRLRLTHINRGIHKMKQRNSWSETTGCLVGSSGRRISGCAARRAHRNGRRLNRNSIVRQELRTEKPDRPATGAYSPVKVKSTHFLTAFATSKPSYPHSQWDSK